MDRPGPSRPWRLAAAAVLSAGVFLGLTLPRTPSGPVIGTGQDEWYNVLRGLQALYSWFDPSYFIHPALYYELLALLYGIGRLVWHIADGGGAGAGFLDYFLAHEAQFLAAARYLSVACGALAVVAAVWLGTLLSGAGAGLLAGVLVATLPLLQVTSTYIRVDALGLAAFVAAAGLVVRHHLHPRRRSRLLAAAGIGVAASANYPGALLLVLLAWFETVRGGDDGASRRARSLAGACALAFAVFIVLNPYVLVDLSRFVRWFLFTVNITVLTHPHAPEPNPWHYLDVLGAQGPPALLACLAGVMAMLAPQQASGALGAFALLYLAAFSALRTQYDRFALPAIVLLCVAGVAWLYGLLASRVPRVAAAFVLLAAPLVLWSAAARSRAEPPVEPGPNYRAEMFEWIARNLPPPALLLIESDTLPIVQTVYDPGDPADRPFQAMLRDAFERRHPRFPRGIVKAQFIGAVYNYDPSHLRSGRAFFLASSQNRDLLAVNRAALADPARFYELLDARATAVHATGGHHERLVLYATAAQCEEAGAVAPPAGPQCGGPTILRPWDGA